MKSRISIIICTYNREKFLPGALASLVTQSIKPSDYEIVIVNNNSTDSTEHICYEFITHNPILNVKYVVEKEKGLSAARNRGIVESASELIAFIDDDAEVEKNYLETAIGFFNQYPTISAMGGKVIPVYETGKEPSWLSAPLWGLVTKVDWGNKTRKYPPSKYPAGCSMVFRKSVFNHTGMFNKDLYLRSDDKYIFRQLEKYGMEFLYYPKLVVKHNIDAYRVTLDSVKKISLIVGASERMRLKNAGLLKNLNKIFEYILKLVAALLFALYFALKLQFKKAEYIIRNRWYTLIGYFKKNLL
jgi:glycosyltransferase involved in cell wall biosynthesis